MTRDPGISLPFSGVREPAFIEELGRYIDGTLQDQDVHTSDVSFERIPGSGREVPAGWACDFDVLYRGKRTRITVSTTAADQ